MCRFLGERRGSACVLPDGLPYLGRRPQSIALLGQAPMAPCPNMVPCLNAEHCLIWAGAHRAGAPRLRAGGGDGGARARAAAAVHHRPPPARDAVCDGQFAERDGVRQHDCSWQPAPTHLACLLDCSWQPAPTHLARLPPCFLPLCLGCRILTAGSSLPGAPRSFPRPSGLERSEAGSRQGTVTTPRCATVRVGGS